MDLSAAAAEFFGYPAAVRRFMQLGDEFIESATAGEPATMRV
jgi:hypothetical protein